ncbi:MAG TPA: glycosyltransferase family 4 protein [Armatimonadota bacterium]|jgi:glycosyltransferase involved in cell wall biosynthesis
MRVLIVSAVYPPEPVVSARTSSDLADEAVRRGHEVTVVAPYPSRPGGRLYEGFRQRLMSRCSDPRGYRLVRCFVTPSNESTLLSRFRENVVFGLTSSLATLRQPRPDVIYSNSWPIFATGMVHAIARLRRVPMVVHVKDLHPESIVIQGRLGAKSRLARTLLAVDRWIARGCRHVVVLTKGFERAYVEDRGIPASRVHVVPDWCEAQSPAGDEDARAYRAQKGIPEDAFVLAYGGNIGVAAGLEPALEAVQPMGNDPRLRVLIAGDGSQLQACKERATAYPEGVVVFESPWPAENTALTLRAASLLFLPTLGKQSLASVPSKLLNYTMSARPILAQALPESELAQIVRESGCGWVVAPDDPEALAAALREAMALEPRRLEAMGEAGRGYALGHYSRDVCVQRVVDLIEQAALSKEEVS